MANQNSSFGIRPLKCTQMKLSVGKFILVLLVGLGLNQSIALADSGSLNISWSGKMPAGSGTAKRNVLSCKECGNYVQKGWLPEATFTFDDKYISTFNIKDAVYQSVTTDELLLLDTNLIPEAPSVYLHTGSFRGSPVTYVRILPLRKLGKLYQKLVSFNYETTEGMFSANSEKRIGAGQTEFATSSVLASGNWYKLAVPSERGLFKLDNGFLQSIGISTGSINPRNIKVYGNGGQQLPQANKAPRLDDLQEIAIYVKGEADGSFNSDDYVLFYSTGTITYTNDSSNTITHKVNIYSDSAYYFVTVGSTPGLRVGSLPNPGAGNKTYSYYDNFWYHEVNKLNPIKSGREWYGEVLDFVNNTTISFKSPGYTAGSPITVKFSGMNAAQDPSGNFANPVQNTFKATLNGEALFEKRIASVPVAAYADFGRKLETTINLPNGLGNSADKLDFYLGYNANGLAQAAGYINYIEINAQLPLSLQDNQTVFRVFDSKTQTASTYQIDAPSTALVWDITNPRLAAQVSTNTSGNGIAFNANNQSRLNEYIVFNGSNFPAPTFVKKVANQNLHAARDFDLLIVTPSEFKDQANRLADFRRTNDRLSVLVTTTEEIYNEFSSGAQDITAIKHAARSLYFQSTQRKIKYLLLFGDCSYDYFRRVQNNTNFVPTYQSEESLSATNSFCSDDYFGFMEVNKGNFSDLRFDYNDAIMDIAVGRLSVKSLAEASDVVDKLIHYVSSSTFGKWRNTVTYVADDGNGFLHQQCADDVAATTETTYPAFTPNKLYLGAFQRMPSPGGYISPDCKNAIKLALQNGSLTFNYSGHGNEIQWADEKILDIDLINSLSNYNNLPLFITATCDFGRHDDPGRTSGAETILIKPKAGGIGIVTTCRPVYADNNLNLNIAFTKAIFRKVNGNYLRLGDIFLSGKNGAIVPYSGAGNRGFAMIGDPSMQLAYPKNKVVLTNINGHKTPRVYVRKDSTLNFGSTAQGQPFTYYTYTFREIPINDTLGGLDKVSMSGEIQDGNGTLMDYFNGKLYITVYDVESKITTNEQSDAGMRYSSFLDRKNILYNGLVTVTAGKWSVSFIVPKDITYVFGKGKISFYATNTDLTEDANGAWQSIVVGGSNEQAGEDNNPPQIRLFMNDTSFINGGVTDSNPFLLGLLADSNGINVSTTGIGHEMTAILDGDKTTEVVLNPYYTSDNNDYRKGVINYPYYNLPDGPHKITVKAWDNYNNSNTASIDFVVASSEKLVLDQIINYPNPFNNQTDFSITHNYAGKPLKVRVEIFNSVGQEVKTLTAVYTESPARLGGDGSLKWDLSQENDAVSTGIYLYRISLETDKGETVKKSKQLVVIK